jgi:hypothetical protein
METLSKARKMEQIREVEKQRNDEKKKLLKLKKEKNKGLEREIFKDDDNRSDTTEREEEVCTCDCKKSWKGYKGCMSFSILAIFACFSCMGKGVGRCFGACCYPIKERCYNSCDKCDGDLNPYKNANYNPYDNL